MQCHKENKLSPSQTDLWNYFANSQFDFSHCFAEIFGNLITLVLIQYWTRLYFILTIMDYIGLDLTLPDYSGL